MNAPVTHHREHSFLLLVAAIVLFVLAAIFFFAVHSVSRDTDFGLIAAGLAAFAAAFVPL
jgi:uncharacterized protein (UPF0333 family)